MKLVEITRRRNTEYWIVVATLVISLSELFASASVGHHLLVNVQRFVQTQFENECNDEAKLYDDVQ